MRKKILCLLPLALWLCGPIAFAKSDTGNLPQQLNRAFERGGRIEMHLQAGDYQIRRCAEDKIHVEWTAKSSAIDRVKVDLTSSGAKANLNVKTPDNGEVHVIIEVPATSHLYVRLSAGDLNVEGVEGDKDIEVHAGDMNLDVGDPDAYAAVDASVSIGDLTAEAFHVSKDGFHNTLRLKGSGRYALHAHVGVGDLRLYGKKKETI